MVTISLFQSTLPREERLLYCLVFVGVVYFNPRSHERSDKKSVDDGDMMSISIHAPTRGATVLDEASAQLNSNFNPRSHERSDITKLDSRLDNVISIHAPTRGATIPPLHDSDSPVYFNPRSHERSDRR